MRTMLEPSDDVELSVSSDGQALKACSSGRVIICSISSGPMPEALLYDTRTLTEG